MANFEKCVLTGEEVQKIFRSFKQGYEGDLGTLFYGIEDGKIQTVEGAVNAGLGSILSCVMEEIGLEFGEQFLAHWTDASSGDGGGHLEEIRQGIADYYKEVEEARENAHG